MTRHCIANASKIVKAGEPATRITKELAVLPIQHGRSEWTEEPPPRLRSHPYTVPKPQAISHEFMMVADYGPQTARLATAHLIPAPPANR